MSDLAIDIDFSSGSGFSEDIKEESIDVLGKRIQDQIQKKLEEPITSTPEDVTQTSIKTIETSPIIRRSKKEEKRVNDTDTLSTRSKQFLTDYIDRLEELKWVHSSASEYYERNNLYLTLPSIILTSISGIISLISSTDQSSPEFKYTAAICVGISSSTSSLFQAVSSTLQFNTKSDLHRDVADRYGKIITKIKFEFIDHSNDDFMLELENQILEVQNMCKYAPPIFLYDAYKEYKEKCKE